MNPANTSSSTDALPVSTRIRPGTLVTTQSAKILANVLVRTLVAWDTERVLKTSIVIHMTLD
jgi:hypothetical protein